jgi:hypothetical protein
MPGRWPGRTAIIGPLADTLVAAPNLEDGIEVAADAADGDAELARNLHDCRVVILTGPHL